MKRCTAANDFGKNIYYKRREGNVHELGSFAVNTETG